MCATEFCPEVVKLAIVNNVDTVLNDAVVSTPDVLDTGVDTPVCVTKFCPEVVKFTLVNKVDVTEDINEWCDDRSTVIVGASVEIAVSIIDSKNKANKDS